MRILTLSTSPHADRSFQIGLGAVLLFAAMEFSALSFHYLRRFQPTRPVAEPAAATEPAKAPNVAARVVPEPATQAVASPAAVVPRHPAVWPPGEVDRLVRDAVALRSKGDMTNALSRLHEAAEREPNNPKMLEEMAKTYEDMQMYDRSSETWQKIQQIGPSAGPSYELALARLKTGVATPGPVVAPRPEPAVKPAGTAPRSVETAATGSLLSIAQVSATEEPDPDADTNLMLRISIKKQPDAVLDHTKVKIQVYFYETADDLGKEIKLTDLQPSFEWVTRNHDWATNEAEVLQVNYVRPKNTVTSSEAALLAAAASVNPAARKGKQATAAAPPEIGKRRYLGYIVRVFYNDKLQAERAEPRSLLRRFPAPGSS